MYFYPEPEPVGHCITDVSPSYLTDGVFFNGRVGPTHKCVAKQLSPILRGPDDPVAPEAEVSAATLDRWTVESKAWYVDNCGRNAKALHAMMKILPKEKIDPYAGWKSKVALFPRSEQYEYWYIRKMRMDAASVEVEEVPPSCTETEINPSEPTAAFEYTRTPIWWHGEIPNRQQCAVGHSDDYEFERRSADPPYEGEERTFVSETENSENIGVYIPGVIYRHEHPDVIGNRESRSGTTCKVKARIGGEGEHLTTTADGNCDCSQYAKRKLVICSKEKVDEDKNRKEAKLEPRWREWREVCDVPRSEEERKDAMSSLFRPYLHEINTWYSTNKPTKLLPPLIFEGKRPILEWHFSNL